LLRFDYGTVEAKKVKKALQPEWLKSLLKRTFFESSCATHPVLKNELNQYCVTCTELICQNCASGPKHVLHKLITIYKHSYKAVVRIDAMREHIDCSQIQPYKSNKLSVIALEPLPHHGSVKWRMASSCKTCRRKLANPNLYRYCSISCKVLRLLRFDYGTVEAKKVKKALQPEWLKSLLKRTFFESSCATHPVLKNELNQYCVTCTELICQNCASGPKHVLHKVITIYKHSYKAVVRIDAMREHIDCSQIQPYKSNKLSVIALEPLPHHGSVKWRRASSCKTCRRKLANPNLYRYCSISCKVQAVLKKSDHSVPPFILLKEDQKEEAGTSKRVNKRKGTPARAPFF
ncbi:hypothetical protein S245_010268, partial [Arachis hypogaea]